MIANQESLGFKAAIASCLVATVYAFQTSPSFSRAGSALKVAVDPSTITNKEYEDICGVSFNEQSLQQRLKSTKYLYPKHVEVIEDIGPLAGRMVDEIVSTQSIIHHSGCHDDIFTIKYRMNACSSLPGPFFFLFFSRSDLILALGNWRESLAATRFSA